MIRNVGSNDEKAVLEGHVQPLLQTNKASFAACPILSVTLHRAACDMAVKRRLRILDQLQRLVETDATYYSNLFTQCMS